MFGNFLYFIVVLLIYTTYQPTEETNFALGETLTLFFILTGFFCLFTWIQFKRLFREKQGSPLVHLDHRFQALLTRQSIMAVALFAIDIYGLNLSAFVMDIPVLSRVPTLQALLFLGLFIFYLIIVWSLAHPVYERIYHISISRQEYIFANVSFALPVLLPWVLFSGFADLIGLLPFETPKQLLATTQGEVVYFLGFLFLIAIVGPAFIQRFWGCRPLPAGSDRMRIEDLCRKADLAYADILYWPIFGGRMITAGVMGLIKKFRYILVTKALLQMLGPHEIDAVIAHEIGHIKKKHLLFYLFFFVGYMLLSYATFDLIIYVIIYAEPLFGFLIHVGINQTTLFSVLFSLLLITSFLVYFRYVFGFFMRNFERQADIYVYALFDTAQPLITTLEKIAHSSGQSPDKPNWHHFSIRERVQYLLRCEQDRSWITRHDQKIKKSILVYVLGMLLLAIVGYQLNFGTTGKKLNTHFFETVILREIDKDPHNAELLSALGDVYYNRRSYGDAIEAYGRAISFEPDNTHALNNLAWLLVTCEDVRLRDNERALTLALRAVTIESAPYILDTLAESYYVNGRIEEAVEAETAALSKATANRRYYQKQLEKFKDALAEQ